MINFPRSYKQYLNQVAVSEQQSEFVYLDKIEEEQEPNKEDEEIGDTNDIIDNIDVHVSARRESVMTSTSSVSGTRAAPFMGQVWRALHRQMSGSTVRKPRRSRRSPRGGLGTPSTSVRGTEQPSNSLSFRSNNSKSSTKSGTHQTQDTKISELERPKEKDKYSSNVDTEDTCSSKL